MAELLQILILFTLTSIVTSMGTRDQGKCTYKFDVWRPDQDVMRTIERIDQNQKNITTSFRMELFKLRTEVLQEVMQMRNATHDIATDIIQQKVENVKLRMQQQELQLNLYKQKESMLLADKDDDDIRESSNSKSGRTDNSAKPQLVKMVTKVKNEVANLQNNIGDLRAEWLLIKREIQKLRHSDNRLGTSYREIVKRVTTVETMVNGMQSDSLLIKRQQNDLMSENTGLGQKVMNVQKENDQLKQYQHRIRKSNSKIQEHLQRLKLENNYLHQSLGKVDSENSRLRAMLGRRAENITKYQYDVKANVPSISDEDIESLSLQTPPRDCEDLYRRGHRTSGQYRIQLDSQQVQVYCDMYNQSGWLVVQRRVDGLLKFNRGWLEYKYGFGNQFGEFWQGNEFLFKISNSGKYTLRIEMQDWEGVTSYADYDHFIIESEKKQYRLHVNKYRGTAGDSLSYHNDMSFSTEDMDNDVHVRNCASDYKGGWWYHTCYSSNLNGVYHTGWYSGAGQTYSDGVVWYTLKQSDFYSLRKVEMKLRPQD